MARRLLPDESKVEDKDKDLLMTCLLLQLASGVAALEEETPSHRFREEVAEMLRFCLDDLLLACTHPYDRSSRQKRS